jgi:tRNA-dihydrouridine synthase
MFRETGCGGVSMGRGALANPWIFRQLVQWEQTGTYDPPGNFDERLQLLLRQFGYLEGLRGTEGAIITFRKMVHWYLKAMRVRAVLRNRIQMVQTRGEFDAVIGQIAAEGPVGGNRTGLLPAMQVPVPSGPVERW